MTVVLFCCPGPATVRAQQPDVHYWHQGVMPPGAIGSRQLQRGGPLPGFYQPVEIKAPAGALISLANGGQFVAPQAVPCRVGLLIGSVYRLRVTNIPLPQGGEGLEVFPSIEVIDRLYAPLGQERRFAIPVELTAEDMELALAGKFVTRVIYVEDPRKRLAAREISKSQTGSRWRRARTRWRRPTGWAVRWRSFAWAAGFPTPSPTADFSSARRRTCPARRRQPSPRKRPKAAGRRAAPPPPAPPRRGNRSHEQHRRTPGLVSGGWRSSPWGC